MIESMQREIDKRFLKRIAAPTGIVVGEAYGIQDTLLFVERRDIKETHAEKEIGSWPSCFFFCLGFKKRTKKAW